MFVSQDAFWGTSNLGAGENATWYSESGRMYRRSNQGRTSSDYFRMWTRSTDMVDASVSVDVRFNGWAGSSTGGWNGTNVWLNHHACVPTPDCSKLNDGAGGEAGYALDFMNRDGSLTILKKVAGDVRSRYPGSVSFANGGTYYQLAARQWSPAQGTTYRLTGSITPNSDGSRTLAIIVNGTKLLEYRDDARLGGPPLRGGRAGLRTDFSDVTFDNVELTRASATPTTGTEPSGSAVLEGEAMALAAGGGANFSDSTASAGAARNIWSNDTASASITTTGNTDELVVRARGTQCSGSPRMVVRVNGAIVLERDVTATSWADHATALSLPAGSHAVAVSFTNDYNTSTCDRNLLLDKVTLVASSPSVTPTTTTTTTTTSTTTTATATPTTAGVEGEAMAMAAGGGGTFADSTASAGAARTIWSNDTASASITTTGATTRIVVRAEGAQCSGAPRMVVRVGTTVVIDASVTATSWTDYAATVSLPAGTHAVSVQFTNDYRTKRCDRNLHLDRVTLLG